MIVIYFILILILLAYHCSCSYREDMVFEINNTINGIGFGSWNCPNWNSASCPEGYYLSGFAANHGCGADDGNNLDFYMTCKRPFNILTSPLTIQSWADKTVDDIMRNFKINFKLG